VCAFNAKLGYKSDDEDDEDDGEGGEEDASDSDGAGQQLPTTPPPQQRQQQQLAACDPSDTPPVAPRAAAALVPGAVDVDDVQEGAPAGADGLEPARSEESTDREVLRLLAEQNQPQVQPQPQPPQPSEAKARRGAKALRRLLSVGDAIEAKYGGIKSTGAWFPGTIVAVSHDGGVLEGSDFLTYSINYDDGDQEHGVLPRFVRPLKADGAVAGEVTHTPQLPQATVARAADKRTLDEADFPDAKRLALESPAAVPEIVD